MKPLCRQRADRGGDVGQAVGHVVQASRKDANLLAQAVDLHARAVELVLERGFAERGHRVVDAFGRLRQHRPHRRHRLEAKLGQAGASLE